MSNPEPAGTLDHTQQEKSQGQEADNLTTLNGREKGMDEELKNSSNGSPAAKVPASEPVKQPKPSKLKEIWAKAGLDVGTVLMMFKGSVAPAIAIAFYQADSVARTFATLGYLVPIITVLCFPILPRAKYFQMLILNILGTCIGSAIGLLGIWSGIQARLHTISPESKAIYNSSQAAVCAIWLFANIWFVNVMRAKLPALQLPVIVYSIFTSVSFTNGALFGSMAAGKQLIKLLLEGFLTAFAISTAVNLFVIPVTSRTVVFKEQAGYIAVIRGTLKAQTAYLQSLETSDMFTRSNTNAGEYGEKNHSKDTKGQNKKAAARSAQNPQAKALKASIKGLVELHGKLYGDIAFAKRECAYGKLSAKDLDEIFNLFRSILTPLIGMSTISDIFERIAERRGWTEMSGSTTHDRSESWEQCEEDQKDEEKRIWNEVMKTLHEPFSVAAQAMDGALEHVGLALELIPKPKKKKQKDEEAIGADPRPGHPDFAEYLKQKMQDFYRNRGVTLKAWAREKGLSADIFDASGPPTDGTQYSVKEAQHRRDQQQLYLILFLEHLLYSTGMAIGKLVEFADKKVADGTMKKSKLILPGARRLKKWMLSIGREDTSVDAESPDSMEAGNSHIYMGAGFNPKKDPEHLAPTNAWQKFGNGLRTIPRFLSSVESAFGLRVALATMTVGIVAFLKDSQIFFLQQRLVWAMIIIAIGMNMTSGQAMFGLLGRLAGTTLAMIFSIVMWYIVNQETAGVIVMLWFFIFLEMYFFMKFPRFLAVWLVTIVTQILIIGYELQTRKIGIRAAEAGGQPFYPIYELAPYRLACVAAGSFISFIWTIFPYPLSDRSWLRKDLGSTLYLLANYYSIVHSTIITRLHNAEGDLKSKDSPGRRLEKVRYKIFGKLVMLLPELAQHADWQKWELTIGGKFPRETYEGIILRATNILNYLTLMSYATQAWSADNETVYPNSEPSSRRAWIDDLSALIDNVSPTSLHITSTLSLLSAAVSQGTSLPPYIQLPTAYDLTSKLEKLDKGILDARHIEEPGYSAYAVMQVASSLVTDDLARLIDHIKDLVGETDFSFSVPGSKGSFETSGSEDVGKGKKD